MLISSATIVGETPNQAISSMDPYLVYVSPYYVAEPTTNRVEVSKHYFMGSQKVATRLESLGYTAENSSSTPGALEDLKDLIKVFEPNATTSQINQAVNGANVQEVYTQAMYVSDKDLCEGEESYDPECLCNLSIYWAELLDQIDCEEYTLMYWYHPDYASTLLSTSLGNNEFISNINGDPHQYFFYSAFGEALYSEHSNFGTYSSPYRFNGKEFDPETGNYYYGARYYDPKTSVWLSVDPMSAAAPGWTPYRFCFNNPVNIVDPTGMLEDDYKLDKKTGEISLIRETDDDFDVLYATDDEANVDENKSVKVNDRSVLPSLSKKDAENYTTRTLWGDKVGSWAKTNSSSDAYGVFKFASDNSDVEWGLQQYSGNRFVLGTSHFSESVGGLNGVSGYDILDLQIDYHSHPGSGAPVDDVASGMMGDQGYASGIVRTFLKNGVDYKNHPQFRIYRPHVAKPYRFNYSPWKTKFNSIAVGSYFDLR